MGHNLTFFNQVWLLLSLAMEGLGGWVVVPSFFLFAYSPLVLDIILVSYFDYSYIVKSCLLFSRLIIIN